MTPELRALTRRQAGTFSWQQARDRGTSRRWVRGGVDRGDIIRVLPEVYAFAGVPTTEHLLAHATHLWAGPDGALSFGTAAVRWRLERPRPHITVSIPATRRPPPPRPWLTVVRASVVPATVIDGLRVTTLARTIADLAQVRTEQQVHAMVLQQVQDRRLHIEDLLEALAPLGTRKGVGVVRRIAAEHDPGFESILTLELLELTRRAGIEGLEVGRGVVLPDGGTLHPDIAVERLRWDLEADGWAFHGSPQQRAADNRRDQRMAMADWLTSRFTTEAIRREQAATVRTLGRLAIAREKALRRRAA